MQILDEEDLREMAAQVGYMPNGFSRALEAYLTFKVADADPILIWYEDESKIRVSIGHTRH